MSDARSVVGEGAERQAAAQAVEYEYYGELKDGHPEGRGEITLETGESYTGEFQHGKYHGEGVLDGLAGRTYVGHFNNGKLEGKVRIYKNFVLEYEGDFYNNNYNGFGELYDTTSLRESRLVYSGHFVNGLFEGEGVQYFVNSNFRCFKYIGTFDSGKRNGKGTLYARGDNKWVPIKAGEWYANTFVSGKKRKRRAGKPISEE